jgi:hypothetical protein
MKIKARIYKVVMKGKRYSLPLYFCENFSKKDLVLVRTKSKNK